MANEVTAIQPDAKTKGPTLSLMAVLTLVVAGGTLFHAWLHHRVNGVVNPTQIALAFFLVINILVTWWEIALFVCYDDVREGYERARGPYEGRGLEFVGEVFRRPVPILQYFSFRVWAPLWTGYSFFDDGYSDKRSFGFNIDVGNGFSTLIPATMFAFGMTFHFLPARVLGIIGIIILWQMFYGTVVYFFQYVNNRRYEGHSFRDLFLVVGLSNLAWAVMPLLGLKVSVDLIMDGSYAVFL